MTEATCEEACSLALLAAPRIAEGCELAERSLLDSGEDIMIALRGTKINDNVNGASLQVTPARR